MGAQEWALEGDLTFGQNRRYRRVLSEPAQQAEHTQRCMQLVLMVRKRLSANAGHLGWSVSSRSSLHAMSCLPVMYEYCNRLAGSYSALERLPSRYDRPGERSSSGQLECLMPSSGRSIALGKHAVADSGLPLQF